AVVRVLPVSNERQESRHNRYLISPETVLAANKEARALGLDVAGYYHSHPDHPARPSEFDRDHAWPGLSYVIVSVEGGKVADTRSSSATCTATTARCERSSTSSSTTTTCGTSSAKARRSRAATRCRSSRQSPGAPAYWRRRARSTSCRSCRRPSSATTAGTSS